MEDIQKMLQIIINGQSAFRQEMLKRFNQLEDRIGRVDIKVDRLEKNLTKRIDKIGAQLAYLEDDAPTREEFDHFKTKVKKLEQSSPTV